MDKIYVLIGLDVQNNLTAPIAKRKFSTYDEAVEHAKTVLNSGGNPNLAQVYIMEGISIAQRTSPPVEIVPISSVNGVTKAA